MHHFARSLCLFACTFSLSSLAAAQNYSGSGSYSTNSGGNASGYAPQRNDDVDNIGADDGQFVFGFDRVTGLYFDNQKITYEGGNEHTYKSTSLNLLGVDSSSPSQLPRFALDYVITAGVTAGVALALSTRSFSLDESGDEAPAQPSTVRPKGTTFLGALRVGYAFPFDETFGIWPRAGISYATSGAEYDITDPSSGETQTVELSTYYVDLDAEVLAVISPVEHIAFMIGPFLDLGLGGKHVVTVPTLEDRRNAKLTSFGLVLNAVGYY